MLPALEQALTEAEATFREAIAKREERSWRKIQTAISTAMASSFDAFCTQTCLAVQQGQLTVSQARSGAEQFLQHRASTLHGWLVPVMNHYMPGCPYGFRRYKSEDTFVFSRDMVEAVQSSEAWVQFLRGLATNAGRKQSGAEQAMELREQLETEAGASEATSHPQADLANTAHRTDYVAMAAEARPEQPVEAEPQELAAERDDGRDRRALVDAFIRRVSEETHQRIRKTDIWRVAGYKDPTEFQRFQRGKGDPDPIRWTG